MLNRSMLLVFAIAIFPLLGQAANQAKFEGTVSNQTCSVLVNGVGSPVILLPTIPVAQLQPMNSAYGEAAFNIALTACPVSTTPVEAQTLFQSNFVDDRGDLINTGTARNVSLTLSATQWGYPIDLRQGWHSGAGKGIIVPA